jgi:hypothetical protein
MTSPLPATAIDPSKTFLRRHVRQEAARGEGVLALRELRARIQQCLPALPRAELDAHLNVDAFFYGGPSGVALYPDLRLYQLVEVFDPLRADDPVARFPELTALLQRFLGCEKPHPGPAGVVVAARGGAGKTVACQKAFLDCLARPGCPSPPLAGWLPCWPGLDVPLAEVSRIRRMMRGEETLAEQQHIKDRQLDQLQDGEVIEELLLRAAGLIEPASRSLLREWLRHGPPLLLSLDLNTAALLDREVIAQSLAPFLLEYDYRHRCVVAYRSTPDDGVVHRLRNAGVFHFYDLAPLSAQAAEAYLRKLRAFEANVYQGLKQSPPAQDIEAECSCLRDLLRRHATGDESLISTPLLLHWVSVLTGQDLGDVGTLADLYDRVVAHFIQRDYRAPLNVADGSGPEPVKRSLPGRLIGSEGPDLVVAAMTRVALAILHEGPGNTRLYAAGEGGEGLDNRFRSLLDNAPGGPRPSWWPNDPWWLEGPYYREHFSQEEIAVIREFSLLHSTGGAIGFVHDSLLHYFAGAVALRCFRRPGRRLAVNWPDARWPARVVSRVQAAAAAWAAPAEFLGGALDAGDAEALVKEVLLAPPASSAASARR